LPELAALSGAVQVSGVPAPKAPNHRISFGMLYV
jgi:hypothetical protein